MSIQVQDLVKTYGKQYAVNGISFEIPSGQVVGFLGPNGAGKSTTMKILTGFISQTAGSAIVSGIDVATNSLEVRKRVGYLPEHNPLYLDMYVREFLLFTSHLNKLGKNSASRVDEMIEKTGLTLERKKKIGALSKGYRQRVGLAQALIHDPEVLILDEPTSGLDPNQITEIRSLIREVGKDKTVLLSTHIMQEVEAMCDRVIIINRGNIVADDSTENLRRNLSSRQEIKVTFKHPIDQKALNSTQGIVEVRPDGGNVYFISADVEIDVKETVFNFAVSTNNIILEQQVQEQRLEDVFRQLTASND